MSEPSTEPTSARPDESPACDTCGRTGAVELGDRLLCPDCFQSSG